jgi:S-DNA-T family DNA segregation ATPase FtsK/SpoIIIE
VPRMHLCLVDPSSTGQPVTVELTTPTGTCFGEAKPHLLRALGATHDTLYAGHVPVPDDATVGLPPLLDGVTLTCGEGTPIPTRRGMLELHVVSGPAAGTTTPLPPGRHLIGRAAESSIMLDDADVSRIHAVLDVRSEGVRLHDPGSANGTWVDGSSDRLDPDGCLLTPGTSFRVGGSTLVLRLPDQLPASLTADGRGHLLVNRPPRLTPHAEGARITMPAEPTYREPPAFPLIMVVIPLILGAGMLVLLDGGTTFLLFILLSPLMLLGNFVSEKLSGRRRNAAARQGYDAALAQAVRDIEESVEEQTRRRRAQFVDAATVCELARGPSVRLWERRPGDPDFLELRVGVGDLPADVDVKDAGTALPQPAAARVLRDVPLTVPLVRAGVLGICGARPARLGLARFVIAQIAAMHSPADVRIVILGPDGAATDWEWAAALPHLRPVSETDDAWLAGFGTSMVNQRITELLSSGPAGSSPMTPRTVVVVDSVRALRDSTPLAQLLARGPAAGVYAVCLDDDAASLPAECGATATAGGSDVPSLRVTLDRHKPVPARIDVLSARAARRLASHLAPLRDSTPAPEDARLPAMVRLHDLLPDDCTSGPSLAARWKRVPAATTAILGTGTGGPFSIDLREDGPHTLVAGTTGAGKSELLQTLLASLAVGNRPDQLSFLLIDYKGGSAFGECADLPHSVGLVTDLDGALTARALSSLRAELARRERRLRDSGCKDIEQYAKEGLRSDLPRLVVVVDEFATLVAELPDFVSGLVDIARRGRSLGVHLVLATQRPGGVVSADIRANTNLRICLRVTDPAESRDVIDVPDAAAIPPAAPGRALARTATGKVTSFQTARVTGTAGPANPEISVRRLTWPHGPRRTDGTVLRTQEETQHESDLSRLVRILHDAADIAACPRPPAPWLPPLPSALSVRDVPAPHDEALPFGLVDLPAEQRRAALCLDLRRDEHVLVVGGPRSGRTTALRALAAGLAERLDPADAHLYVVDLGRGALARLASLPHCGAVIGPGEAGRGQRLIERLSEEVRRRQRLLTQHGLSSVAEQRHTATADSRLPWLVVLVDGWEHVLSAFDAVDHGRPVEAFVQLMRDGAAAGVRIVVAGDRTALTGRLASLAADRLVLPLSDTGDYALAGIPARGVPAQRPAGRAVRASDGAQAQVALLDADPHGAAQQAALAALVAAAADRARGDRDVPRPLRVDALPVRVFVEELDRARRNASAPLEIPIGVGGDELAPVCVDLDAAAFLVAGPRRSGVSTSLAAMAEVLSRRRVTVGVVADSRSPLHRLPARDGVTVLGEQDSRRLTSLLRSSEGPVAVLVDGETAFRGGEIEDCLLGWLRAARSTPYTLVCGTRDDEAAAAFRGLAHEARRGGKGLLLQPDAPVAGQIFGVRPPLLDRHVPGRGVLVVAAGATPVQVAQPTTWCEEPPPGGSEASQYSADAPRGESRT